MGWRSCCIAAVTRPAGHISASRGGRCCAGKIRDILCGLGKLNVAVFEAGVHSSCFDCCCIERVDGDVRVVQGLAGYIRNVVKMLAFFFKADGLVDANRPARYRPRSK